MIQQSTDIILETVYQKLRAKEGRMYTDEQVSRLPEIDKSHPYYQEWKLRKQSCNRLIRWIGNKPLQILEIGSGNGWLTAQLAQTISGQITGLELEGPELNQARRVFSTIKNLQFISGCQKDLAPESFDLVLLAASIQYFSSLPEIITDTLGLLKPGGTIHIIDSIFYHSNELNAAQKRSADYFENLGFPEMRQHYHHHSLKSLEPFSPQFLKKPNGRLRSIFWGRNPFYHIVIEKKHEHHPSV